MTLVETEVVNSVMTITLADEERRNALSVELTSQLFSAVENVESDPDVRLAVLTNRGRAFCAGADLAEQAAPESEISGRGKISLSELLERIRRCPKPFIGRIAGHCSGGGVGLAAVMDISVAIEGATFGFSEVRVGVVPAIISVVCAPKMRLGDVQSTFIRGNRFSAAEAVRMGLINSAVPKENLDDEVNAVINDVLAGEPNAVGIAKHLAGEISSMDSVQAFAWATELSERLFLSEAAQEGMTAFLEKRPASWVRRN